MANKFTWQFPQLDVIYSADGFTNVVQAVHWVYQGTNGTTYDTVYEQIAGLTPLPLPQGTFVNYDDLTPEIVTGWVKAALGPETVAKMTADINARIASKAKPTGKSEAPPWDQA